MIQSILLLLLLSGHPAASEPSIAADCPTAPEPDKLTPVISRPNTDEIAEAGLKARKRTAKGIVLLKHDATGNVTHAVFEKSSGDKRVDGAILKWAKRVKMQPGACGFSKVSAGFSKSS